MFVILVTQLYVTSDMHYLVQNLGCVFLHMYTACADRLSTVCTNLRVNNRTCLFGKRHLSSTENNQGLLHQTLSQSIWGYINTMPHENIIILIRQQSNNYLYPCTCMLQTNHMPILIRQMGEGGLGKGVKREGTHTHMHCLLQLR